MKCRSPLDIRYLAAIDWATLESAILPATHQTYRVGGMGWGGVGTGVGW